MYENPNMPHGGTKRVDNINVEDVTKCLLKESILNILLNILLKMASL